MQGFLVAVPTLLIWEYGGGKEGSAEKHRQSIKVEQGDEAGGPSGS